jgi:hypothetical protein
VDVTSYAIRDFIVVIPVREDATRIFYTNQSSVWRIVHDLRRDVIIPALSDAESHVTKIVLFN